MSGMGEMPYGDAYAARDVYGVIHNTGLLRRLALDPDIDREALTRAVLFYLGKDPEEWGDWQIPVVEAALAYRENNRREDVEDG